MIHGFYTEKHKNSVNSISILQKISSRHGQAIGEAPRSQQQK